MVVRIFSKEVADGSNETWAVSDSKSTLEAVTPSAAAIFFSIRAAHPTAHVIPLIGKDMCAKSADDSTAFSSLCATDFFSGFAVVVHPTISKIKRVWIWVFMVLSFHQK